ncbi:MAG: hypothetical protein LBG65_06965 [Puniceicoccales bacterium]|jgi:general secretion pathway protein D|nr:hypothetical protein [Puniceicoccales bacterium]
MPTHTLKSLLTAAAFLFPATFFAADAPSTPADAKGAPPPAGKDSAPAATPLPAATPPPAAGTLPSAGAPAAGTLSSPAPLSSAAPPPGTAPLPAAGTPPTAGTPPAATSPDTPPPPPNFRPRRGFSRGNRFGGGPAPAAPEQARDLGEASGDNGATDIAPASFSPRSRRGPGGANRATLDPAEIVGPIILSDAELVQVITLFEKLSGKYVIRPLLPGVRINFNAPENITRAQALLAIETLLAKNQVALTPVPGTDFYNATYVSGFVSEVPPLYTSREEVEKLPPTLSTISRLFVLQNTTAQLLEPTLKTLVNAQRGETVLVFPAANAVLFTSTVQNVQRAEKIVEKLDAPHSVLFFKLKHIRATDVKKYFTNLYTGPNPLRGIIGGDITIEADDLANHLMVVTPPQNREKVRSIIEEMDRNNVELMFFRLKYIRASDVKKLIQSLQGGSTATPMPGRPGGAAAAATTAFSNVLGGDFVIEADDLANHLMIVAQPQIRDRLQKVIEDMDRDNLPKTTSETLSLRHSDVLSVMESLRAIVVGASSGTGSAASNTGANVRSTNNTTRASTSAGDAAQRNTYSTTSFSTRKTSTQTVPNAYTWGPNGQVPATITQPGTPNSFSDYLTVTGEERTNRLIIFGTAEDIKQIKEIVSKIDIPLPQVRIEAVIVEVNLTNAESSGLSTLGIGYRSNAGTSSTGWTSQRTNPEYTLNTSMMATPGTTTPPFAVTGSLRDFSLSVIFGLAEINSRVRILSAPLISTTHNQEARITVGENRPYPGSVTYTGNSGIPIASTEFANIKLELIVTPRISSDGAVEMYVVQSNKSLAGTVTINDNPTPIISERSASSTLVAGNNETVVLAGLQSYKETQTKGIMWFLGYIPIIGQLFRPETDDTTRTELIVFLRPHVIQPGEGRADATMPGLMPDSLTQVDARSYIDTGRFGAVSLTEDERAAIEEIRRRQAENAAATRAAQPQPKNAPPASGQ